MTRPGAPYRARLAETQLALMLLTRFPAGRLPAPAPPIGAAVWAFPLAGLAVGALAAVVLWAGLGLGLPAQVAAGLAIAVQIIATGALHEDGLADLADGLWGGRDPARRLEIMRDSHIGSYGTLALVLGVGLRWQALACLAQDRALALAVLVAVAMLSRLAPVALMAALAPARGDGLGHSARGVRPSGWLVAGLICLPLALVPGMALAALAAALVVLGVGWLARARLGGQTGDVLGAAQQLAEITLLVWVCAMTGGAVR